MGNYVEIILLAMVAVFVGLRLFSVLGQKTGHEQEPAAPRPTNKGRPHLRPVPDPIPDSPPEVSVDIPDMEDTVVSPAADSSLRRIASADSGFDINEFLHGAQSAYGMILEAFWKGDKDDLRHLVGDDVYAAFDGAIDAREEAGHVLDNRLATIERTIIEAAELDGKVARVRVRFDADIAAVTRDKDGDVVAGSLSDAVSTHDIWTFERNLRDNDPNWTLVETDEAA